MPRTILVIPEYNEARTIVAVLERAYPYADLLVVVDDGSKDASPDLVRTFADNHPKLILLSHPDNRGMSGALLTGFSFLVDLFQKSTLTASDIVVTIDADGQHRPEEISEALLAMHCQEVDVLLGCRDLSGYPRIKQFGNRFLSLWASLLSGMSYADVECGFRLMRMEVVRDLLQFFTGRRYGCAQEIGIITARRGFKIANNLPTAISYYRKGARVRDGFTNMAMGFLAFCRVVMNIRSAPDARATRILGLLDERPDGVDLAL